MYDAESAVCIALHLGDHTICTVKGENVNKIKKIRGRMEPCFYVVYNKFGLYHLRVAAQIESLQTK